MVTRRVRFAFGPGAAPLLLALVFGSACSSTRATPAAGAHAVSRSVAPAAKTAAAAGPGAAPQPPSAAPEAAPPLVDADAAFGGDWERADPAAFGVDTAELGRIVAEAERTRSDSLLVLRDGKILVERYFGKPKGPIETMSATKSVVSIAIGMLVAEGRIRSIDEPLSTWFSDWGTGRKKAATLRHLLTQTSGLEHRSGANVLNQNADRSKYVRALPMVDEPGKRFSYSNEATQLLSAIAKSAAGKPLDAYVEEKLFRPLDIRDWRWEKDRAGNVQAYYGLALTARDLAKIGLMMLAGGTWHEARLVPAEWVLMSTTEQVPGSSYGFLWWVRNAEGHYVTTADRLAELEARGFAAAAKLRPLVDRPIPANPQRYWMEVGARLDDPERSALAALVDSGSVPYVERHGDPIGFAADGWLGQQLIVLPSRGIVAVRQHREPTNEHVDQDYNRRFGFFSLVHEIEKAAPIRSQAQAPR